ncbi:hypothetical protein [Sphingobacterium paludis]|uniref:Uncharacterized protein n=1 Tax=Sphingobacterium paludis TaxID=1476465 RepID=A0A4R7D4U8_9SPHI|nr:hypothetical protein [Sphingobacterium paludis]TDS14725.1 hypothetical protein B0I21_103224 [Sphingobacterium paludis]
MAVLIKPKFDVSEVKKEIADYKLKMLEKVASILVSLADTIAEDIRTNADYMNHSYNLRSSSGTIVFRDGLIIHENFKLMGDGSEGLAKGKKVAEENVPPSGIGMMLIAGEDYASYVEAKDNKWVITGSSMMLARLLQRMV